MDLLQVALVFLILLLSVFLSILGIQVFLILKDLRKSLDKFDLILGSAQEITQEVEKPVKAAAEVVSAIEAGVKAVKNIATKNTSKAVAKSSPRRFFKRL